MSIEELKRPERIDEERIQKLKELFPEAFWDGKINIDVLNEEIQGLKEDIVEENEEGFYGLHWIGKREARRLAYLPPQGTLKKSEEGINIEETKNILIEGDNLEVLRQLNKSYSNRVKLIFIDPPYNTGSDLIYKDEFKDPVDRYLYKSKQTDEDGLLTSNPKSGGRFHTNWLNMMYPRLKLARSFLKDDGVLCITIGEEEMSNLKLIANEIFGESNFLGCIIWKKKTNGNNVGFIPSVHDYILCYALNAEAVGEIGFPVDEEYIKKNYSNSDNDPRGPWTIQDLSANHVGPSFPITNPLNGEVHYPPSGRYWVFNEQEVKKRIENGRIIFGKSGVARPVQKVFLNEKLNKKRKSSSIWDKHGMNEDGTEELARLFGTSKVFSHPKPSKLLKNLLNMFTESQTEDIIMDFFAGSGTTGHAVLELNEEDEGNRKFILIQLPETVEANGYSNIADITKSRITKVIEELNQKDGNAANQDRGFALYKMDKTNIRKWENYNDTNISELNENLDLFTTLPFKEDANKLDIVIELMLFQGFPLDSSIVRNTIESNLFWTVKNPSIPFSLILCLDEKLEDNTSSYLINNFREATFVCLDIALNNKQKILLSEIMKVKTI